MPTEKAHGYQICKMCEEFARIGATVELWYPSLNNKIKQNVFQYYNLEKNFLVKKIKSPQLLYLEKYIGGTSFILQNILYLLKIYFLRIEDGLIYTRDAGIAYIFSRKGKKVVYECHLIPQKRKWLFKFLLKRTHKIAAMTSYIRKELIKMDFFRGEIDVFPDGVDLKIFDLDLSNTEAREKLDLPANEKIVGYTGNFKTMGEDKGILDILEAVKILKERGKKIFFVAVGGNYNNLKEYGQVVKKKEIEDRVILIGRVSLRKLAICQKACDILLMPFPNSLHFDYYMSPLKMFEYMASKRPIVTSGLPSIQDVLNEGNAVFCEPHNPDNLAIKIEDLLINTNLAKELATAAYEKVRMYSWDNRAKNIFNFIKK